MTGQSSDVRSVALSLRVYQLLLNAYPAGFQQEYGPAMVQVFQDCCLRAFRQSGTNGMVRLWAITLLDYLRSLFEQHAQKEIGMSKSQLIRFSGWAFILGSFAFATILSGSDALAFPGSVISAILLAIGMSGLRARYGKKAGGFGRTVLLVSVIGMMLYYLGLMLLVLVALLPANRPQAESLVSSGLWVLMFGGPVVVLLGLTLFGLAALRSQPMPRFNWLPALTGIWYPAFYFFMTVYVFTRNGVYPGQFQAIFNMMNLMQFLTLCVFGAILVSDTPPEMAPA